MHEYPDPPSAQSDNPCRGFLGDVDLPAGTMPPYGYSVYAGPVAATLRSFGLEARARLDWNLDNLKAKSAAGRPAIIWATTTCVVPAHIRRDRRVSLDAYDTGTKHFAYDAFLPAWEQLGSMAVTMDGPLSQPVGRA